MPNLQRLEYKLSYTGDSDVRLYTWNDLAKRLYEMVYTFSDKEIKATDKFLAALNLNTITGEEDRIKAIEEAIKKNIVLSEETREDKIDYALEKKTTNELGIVRLHAACFKAAGIQNELGVSSNRFQYPMDDKFENWNKLDIYIFYFPKQKQYSAPASSSLRYPSVLAAVRENKALFCKITTVGSLTSAIASIRNVPALPMAESSNDIHADITFEAESMTPSIKFTHTFKGYSAFGIREMVTFITKDKEKELAQSLVSIADAPEDLVSFTINNKGLEHYSDNKPVEVQSVVKADQLMEKAGGKWLFKVGDVIGRQAEMYQDKKRMLPIGMPFPHSLGRDIVVNIPAGYKISNPDAVRIDVKDKDNTMGFVSDYTIKDNKMVIHINEYYSRSSYPLSEIEPFRKVINAAADFNKVTLVMEKE
jgi:hypothetical protein